MSSVAIAIESPLQDDVRALLAAEDALMNSLYSPDDNHLLDANDLAHPSIVFFVARQQNAAVGCGALVRCAGYGEVKRMFVDALVRGQGIGRLLLESIVRAAESETIPYLRLETGIYQPEAIGLYRALGLYDIAPFGGYADSEVSLFMEKRLARN